MGVVAARPACWAARPRNAGTAPVAGALGAAERRSGIRSAGFAARGAFGVRGATGVRGAFGVRGALGERWALGARGALGARAAEGAEAERAVPLRGVPFFDE